MLEDLFVMNVDRMLTAMGLITGNNYAITNESRTKSAKVFFAQGCVVDGVE